MHYRKIIIRFNSDRDIEKLSERIFKGTKNKDAKIPPNVKEARFSKDDFSFTYKRKIKKKQKELKEWEKHWTDMSYFVGEKKKSNKTYFYFSSEYSNEELSELLEQPIGVKTTSIYYPMPKQDDQNVSRILMNRGNPQYPIYVISKGRSDSCVTADFLIKMDVPFRIVIEKSDWNDYKRYYDESILLELEEKFRDEYDTYIDNFDESRSKGSGPARNFVWWHAKNIQKSEYHWIIDDNIFGFCYYMNTRRLLAVDGSLFACAEDFINRYENIAVAGLNYYSFTVPSSKDTPYVANTKIYSCLLIKNNLPFRWGGRYNEDVDLCIRALKEGYSTIQFDAYISKKAATQTMKGGNTDAFYAEEGTLPKSNMLAHNHPDITHVQWRYQRWHHMTDYSIFDIYKDRTMGDCIIEMQKEPLLELNSPEIQEIRNLDLKRTINWSSVLVNSTKREEILDVLKFYKYTNDNERIIDILTAPKLLNCDYYDYIWDHEIPDTNDNRIMKELFKLESEFEVPTVHDWDKILDGKTQEEKTRIVKIIQRNKYMRKQKYKIYNYDFKEFFLNEKDHAEHQDSKARIINKFVNKDSDNKLPEPITHYDRKIRREVKNEKSAPLKNKLTARYGTHTKETDNYTVMITGSDDFGIVGIDACMDDSVYFFNKKVKELLSPKCTEIINAVYAPADLMAADYALTNKMKNKEFVPDETSHTDAAYRKLYSCMAEYTDECIIFLKTSNRDIEFLIEELTKKNKKVHIVKCGTQTEELDW